MSDQSFGMYLCSRCPVFFFVSQGDLSNHLLVKPLRCPESKCKGSLYKKAVTNLADDASRVISALELYQACKGLGIPSEQAVSHEEVLKVLVGAKIVEANVQAAEHPFQKRPLLLSLTLDNGKTLHIATSTQGPMVYKVTNAG